MALFETDANLKSAGALVEVARPVSLPTGSTADTSNRINASFGVRF